VSAEERFFNPKVLARVAGHVEWPGNLEVYRNGKTNQGEFMRAVAQLYGQLLVGEYLPDAWTAAKVIAREDWQGAFRFLLQEIPEKVEQFVGFWQGFFQGALSRRKGFWGPLNPWTGQPTTTGADPDKDLEADLRMFVVRLASIIEGVYDDG